MRVRLWLGIGSWAMIGSLPVGTPDGTAWSLAPPALATVPNAEDAENREERQRASRELRSILSLLRGAYGEYAEAVRDGMVWDGTAYLGSRGLFAAAQTRFARVEAALAANHPVSTDELRAEMAQLAAAWEPAIVPTGPVPAPGDVAAAIARIHISASRMLRTA